MKTIKYIMAAVSVAITLLSCEAQLAKEVNNVVTITAENEQIQPDTKTVIDNQTLKISWLANDAINVFFGASESSRFVTTTSGRKAQFKGSVGVITGGGYDLTDDTSLWGVYPYKGTTTCDGTSITYTLPANQEAKENSFADDLFPQIARSQNLFMSFYNLCGSFRFTLSREDIVKVTLSGNNGESLAGKVKATMPLGGVPAVSEVLDGTTTLTMTAPEGECFKTGVNYYFVLYPTVFSKGLTLTFYTADSKAIFNYTGSYTLARNQFVLFDKLDGKLNFEKYEDNTNTEPSVPVESIKLDQSSLVLKEDFSYKLLATIIPSDATNQNIAWSSSNSSIVTVDNSGMITTLSAGIVDITAEISGMTATCKVKVIPLTSREMIDYEENGVNYGKGIAIGDIIWAPINCDFLPDSYPTSKFFQWGRKFGQIDWAEDLEFVEGPISLSNGQRDIYQDVVFIDTSYQYDWASEYNNLLCNRGTDQNPLKSEYDPCPDGWRIPTSNELRNLIINSGDTGSQSGTYFCGEYTYLKGAPMIRLPKTGYRNHLGEAYTYKAYAGGEYWSSYTTKEGAYFLFFLNEDIKIKTGSRCHGRSIRCVQE